MIWYRCVQAISIFSSILQDVHQVWCFLLSNFALQLEHQCTSYLLMNLTLFFTMVRLRISWMFFSLQLVSIYCQLTPLSPSAYFRSISLSILLLCRTNATFFFNCMLYIQPNEKKSSHWMYITSNQWLLLKHILMYLFYVVV